MLNKLEQGKKRERGAVQLSLFETELHAIDPLKMTPLEALQQLLRWKTHVH
jgi:hypothetical protein